jgi:hypothetical protein
MTDFLFRKDLWILDLAAVSFFAYQMGAFQQSLSDSLQSHPERVWVAGCISAFTYLVGFVLALKLKRRHPSAASWMLIGLSGALLQILLRMIGDRLPRIIDDHLRFSDSTLSAIGEIVTISLLGIGFNFVLWAILGCIFILAVRSLAYCLLGLRRLAVSGFRIVRA